MSDAKSWPKKTARQVEVRWMLLAEDGRYGWVGRHTDPSEDEIAAFEASMRERGTPGWLAVHRGDFWDRRSTPELVMVRPMAAPTLPWEVGVETFLARRNAYLAGVA